jgi:hypothetical protein
VKVDSCGVAAGDGDTVEDGDGDGCWTALVVALPVVDVVAVLEGGLVTAGAATGAVAGGLVEVVGSVGGTVVDVVVGAAAWTGIDEGICSLAMRVAGIAGSGDAETALVTAWTPTQLTMEATAVASIQALTPRVGTRRMGGNYDGREGIRR